jgi:uroporphyrinogen-III decarboxylase
MAPWVPPTQSSGVHSCMHRGFVKQVNSSVPSIAVLSHGQWVMCSVDCCSGGLLERMGSTGADVIGLDWTVDMEDARRRLGPDQAVQVGNKLPI